MSNETGSPPQSPERDIPHDAATDLYLSSDSNEDEGEIIDHTEAGCSEDEGIEDNRGLGLLLQEQISESRTQTTEEFKPLPMAETAAHCYSMPFSPKELRQTAGRASTDEDEGDGLSVRTGYTLHRDREFRRKELRQTAGRASTDEGDSLSVRTGCTLHRELEFRRKELQHTAGRASTGEGDRVGTGWPSAAGCSEEDDIGLVPLQEETQPIFDMWVRGNGCESKRSQLQKTRPRPNGKVTTKVGPGADAPKASTQDDRPRRKFSLSTSVGGVKKTSPRMVSLTVKGLVGDGSKQVTSENRPRPRNKVERNAFTQLHSAAFVEDGNLSSSSELGGLFDDIDNIITPRENPLQETDSSRKPIQTTEGRVCLGPSAEPEKTPNKIKATQETQPCKCCQNPKRMRLQQTAARASAQVGLGADAPKKVSGSNSKTSTRDNHQTPPRNKVGVMNKSIPQTVSLIVRSLVGNGSRPNRRNDKVDRNAATQLQAAATVEYGQFSPGFSSTPSSAKKHRRIARPADDHRSFVHGYNGATFSLPQVGRSPSSAPLESENGELNLYQATLRFFRGLPN